MGSVDPFLRGIEGGLLKQFRTACDSEITEMDSLVGLAGAIAAIQGAIECGSRHPVLELGLCCVQLLTRWACTKDIPYSWYGVA
jgi:hypothetical protein